MRAEDSRVWGGVPLPILRMLVVSGLTAVAAIVGLTWWMANVANGVAEETTARLVETTLAAEIERVETLTDDYGEWPEAYDWVRTSDDEAVYSNIGTGATESDAFDLILLTTGGGAPLYAFASEGEASDLSVHDRHLAQTATTAVAAQPLSPYQVVSGFARVRGKITAVAAGRVQPYETAGLTSSDLPVMIGASVLDSDRLQGLGDKLLIKHMRLADPADTPLPGFAATTLRGIDGGTVAQVVWQIPRPGDRTLAQAFPVILVVAVALFLGNVFVGRASAKQAAGILRARKQARTDPLTGLMNRAGLAEMTTSAALTTSVQDRQIAVIYMDINNFKHLNDQVGHDGGDEALRTTADRLRRSMRSADFVARIGGDEFVAVVVDPRPEETARTICERITLQTERPLRIAGAEVEVRVSMGISVADGQALWEDLLVRADAAMYQAKRQSLLVPVVYTAKLRTGLDLSAAMKSLTRPTERTAGAAL